MFYIYYIVYIQNPKINSFIFHLHLHFSHAKVKKKRWRKKDYITSVKIYYEKLFGSPIEIVTALIFKTFKGKTSQPFGLTSGEEAELGGGKIVGFHGSSSDLIHSVGVYIIPSTTPLTPPVSGVIDLET
ncbi:unnamed protein product [Arabidopsis thaliana]|uniref:(thale cress) hypothetical protein n=1 Tax=Arabidopsis thaliana TaxID=3702 RepID=A0A7G2ELD7_ARATH|nr:unnamed protein product [Arabidopsis thaliana]